MNPTSRHGTHYRSTQRCLIRTTTHFTGEASLKRLRCFLKSDGAKAGSRVWYPSLAPDTSPSVCLCQASRRPASLTPNPSPTGHLGCSYHSHWRAPTLFYSTFFYHEVYSATSFRTSSQNSPVHLGAISQSDLRLSIHCQHC